MIDDPPLVDDPAAREALLGLLAGMRWLDALLARDAEAPPTPTPVPPGDPILQAALGIVALRRRLGGALAQVADGASDLGAPAPPSPPPRDLLR